MGEGNRESRYQNVLKILYAHTNTYKPTCIHTSIMVTVKHELRAMKLRKLSWHTLTQDCPPAEAGVSISIKHEKQKRSVDGNSSKVIRGRKDNCYNISTVK